MKNPKQNKNRKEYWTHKLKSEINYVTTQKNERAIDEYAEDVVQYIELCSSKESKLEDLEGYMNKLQKSLDDSSGKIDYFKWVLFGSVIVNFLIAMLVLVK